uniref:ThiF family adenylyltransferase n=1 Tax=Desulfobacca acetoxidans TaxID=60893 RepID=A0A7C5EVM7_9BACT
MIPANPNILEGSGSSGLEERLDRQLRIPGWNQEALAQARVGLCGDDPWLTGLFVVSAAALGLQHLTVVAPDLDPHLLEAARGLNRGFNLAFFPGFFSHFLLEELFSPCQVLIDLSHHALANKLLLNLAHQKQRPLVRSFAFQEKARAGGRLFTYMPGREWLEIGEIISSRQLPTLKRGDPILSMVLAGLALEETKKLILGEAVTAEVITYARPLRAQAGLLPGEPLGLEGSKSPPEPTIAVVGAGALGNFVGLGLAAAGFTRVTFLDPDPVEVTNLNRQILFWDKVGQPKAKALAERLREWFGLPMGYEITYVHRDSDLSPFSVVFDCTDNFESRIVLSEQCREGGQLLISGGTGVTAGQVVVWLPHRGGPTPAELLGLYELVEQRQGGVSGRERASCAYVPEPAVIMTNQIIGGLMVDLLLGVLAGEEPRNLFFDAQREKMLSD